MIHLLPEDRPRAFDSLDHRQTLQDFHDRRCIHLRHRDRQRRVLPYSIGRQANRYAELVEERLNFARTRHCPDQPDTARSEMKWRRIRIKMGD